jgi:hypothetical protein
MHRPTLVFLKRYKIFEPSRAREMYEQIDVNLGPLLPFTGRARGWEDVGKGADTRQFFDMSNSFGLTTLEHEMRKIMAETAADWYSDVAARIHRDPGCAILDLAGEARDLFEAVRMSQLDARLESVGSGSARSSGFDRFVRLGADCLSLIVEHQLAFQEDLLAWLEKATSDRQ